MVSALPWQLEDMIRVQIECHCKRCLRMTLVGSSCQNKLAKSEKPNELAEQMGEIQISRTPTLGQ